MRGRLAWHAASCLLAADAAPEGRVLFTSFGGGSFERVGDGSHYVVTPSPKSTATVRIKYSLLEKATGRTATGTATERHISSRNSPDMKASEMAATTYQAVPCSATPPTATAIIRETTATGPTASVRLVPKTA